MGYDAPDVATNFLQEVAEKTAFNRWFFGHYHDDRAINMEYHLMYFNIALVHNNDRGLFSALGQIEQEERT